MSTFMNTCMSLALWYGLCTEKFLLKFCKRQYMAVLKEQRPFWARIHSSTRWNIPLVPNSQVHVAVALECYNWSLPYYYVTFIQLKLDLNHIFHFPTLFLGLGCRGCWLSRVTGNIFQRILGDPETFRVKMRYIIAHSLRVSLAGVFSLEMQGRPAGLGGVLTWTT